MMSIRRATVAVAILSAFACGRDTAAPVPEPTPTPSPPKRSLVIVPSPLIIDFHSGVYYNVVDAADTSHAYKADEVIVRSSDPWIAGTGACCPGGGVWPTPFVAGANAPGTVTIEALLRSDTTVRGSTTATVLNPRILITGQNRIDLNGTATLSARTTGLIGIRVTWSSSDTNIATIRSVDNSTGQGFTPTALVFGKELGTATITAIDVDNRSQAGSMAVTVIPSGVAAVRVTPTAVTLNGPRDSASVQVVVDRIDATRPALIPTLTSRKGLVTLTSVTNDTRTRIAIRPIAPGRDTVVIRADSIRVALPVTVVATMADSLTAISTQPTPLNTPREWSGNPTSNVIFLPSRNGRITPTGPNSATYTSVPGFFGVDSVHYIVGRDTGLSLVAVGPGPYSVVPVLLGGSTLKATAINDRDEVTGTITAPDGSLRAFRWAGEQVTLLAATTTASGVSINNFGDVAGNLGTQAAVWFAGATTPTILFPAATRATRAIAINDNRRVLAYTGGGTTSYDNRSFLWSTSKVDTVSALGCEPSIALNNRDQMMGKTCPTAYPSWFLVPTFGYSYPDCHLGRQSTGIALNDSSFVLGWTEVLVSQYGGLGSDYCLWRPGGRTTDLTIDSRNRVRSVVALNDRGWALLTQAGQGVNQGLLYLGIGAYANLADLFSGKDTPGWTITAMSAMNNRGTILATAIDKSTGKQASVLLVPQIAPGSHP